VLGAVAEAAWGVEGAAAAEVAPVEGSEAVATEARVEAVQADWG